MKKLPIGHPCYYLDIDEHKIRSAKSNGRIEKSTYEVILDNEKICPRRRGSLGALIFTDKKSALVQMLNVLKRERRYHQEKANEMSDLLAHFESADFQLNFMGETLK